jgi:predicted alpha/beta-fold hydrolase
MKKFSFVISVLCVFISNIYSYNGKILIIKSPEAPFNEIEIYIQEAKAKDAPLLITLHGVFGDGIHSIDQSWYDHWIEKGYAMASISMPGFGKTTGRKDCCGPFTINTLHIAIDYIKKELGVSDFGIIGAGYGSVAGALLCAQRNDIRCLTCSNGVYDYSKHNNLNDILGSRIISRKDNFQMDSEEAVQVRSPIAQVPYIDVPIFILHREKNPLVSEREVYDFADAMKNAGKECCVSIRPKTSDSHFEIIEVEELFEDAETWIDHHMNG